MPLGDVGRPEPKPAATHLEYVVGDHIIAVFDLNAAKMPEAVRFISDADGERSRVLTPEAVERAASISSYLRHRAGHDLEVCSEHGFYEAVYEDETNGACRLCWNDGHVTATPAPPRKTVPYPCARTDISCGGFVNLPILVNTDLDPKVGTRAACDRCGLEHQLAEGSRLLPVGPPWEWPSVGEDVAALVVGLELCKIPPETMAKVKTMSLGNRRTCIEDQRMLGCTACDDRERELLLMAAPGVAPPSPLSTEPVVVELSGGVAKVTSQSPGVTVRVLDHDVKTEAIYTLPDCPVNDPDCTAGDDQNHDACVSPESMARSKAASVASMTRTPAPVKGCTCPGGSRRYSWNHETTCPMFSDIPF